MRGLDKGGIGTTSNVGYVLRRKLTRQELRKSRAEDQFKTRAGFNAVDWDMVGRATKSNPQQFRLWITKHVSGCNDSGQLQVHLGRRETNLCPICNGEIKTSQHHVLYTQIDRRKIFEEDLLSLLLWMQSTTSDPDFAEAFYKFLRDQGILSLSDITSSDDSSTSTCSDSDSDDSSSS